VCADFALLCARWPSFAVVEKSRAIVESGDRLAALNIPINRSAQPLRSSHAPVDSCKSRRQSLLLALRACGGERRRIASARAGFNRRSPPIQANIFTPSCSFRRLPSGSNGSTRTEARRRFQSHESRRRCQRSDRDSHPRDCRGSHGSFLIQSSREWDPEAHLLSGRACRPTGTTFSKSRSTSSASGSRTARSRDDFFPRKYLNCRLATTLVCFEPVLCNAFSIFREFAARSAR
jgi:hypothetical protein